MLKTYVFPIQEGYFYRPIVCPGYKEPSLPKLPVLSVMKAEPSKQNPEGNDCAHLKAQLTLADVCPDLYTNLSWYPTRVAGIKAYECSYTGSRIPADTADFGFVFDVVSDWDESQFYFTHQHWHQDVSPDGHQSIYRHEWVESSKGSDLTTFHYEFYLHTLGWKNSYYYGNRYWYSTEYFGTQITLDDSIYGHDDHGLAIIESFYKNTQEIVDMYSQHLQPDMSEYNGRLLYTFNGYATEVRCDFTSAAALLSQLVDQAASKFDVIWRRWVLENDGYQAENFYPDLGDMCLEAASSVRAEHVNLISEIRELTNLPEDTISGIVNDFTNIKRDFSSFRNLRKSMANKYLQGKYGPRLTIMDLKTMYENSQKASRALQKFYCAHSERLTYVDLLGLEWEGKVRVGFEAHFDWFNQIWCRADEQNTLIRASDLWDLVPYSFVVDWYIDIGGFLKKREDRSFYEHLTTENAWLSSKLTTTYSVGQPDHMTIGVKVTRYSRQGIETTAPKIRLGTSSDFKHHLLEQGALWVQNGS